MFERKLPEASDTRRVREQILSAFKDVRIPETKEIIRRPSTGDKASESRIREALVGKRWDALSTEFLKEYWSAFYYLSAKAFRYYLPALLITSLDHTENDGDFYHTALFELNPSAYAIYYEGTDRHFHSQTSLFTEEQFRAVSAYLGLFLNDEYPYSWVFLAGRAFRWGWDRVETPERKAFGDFYHRMHHFQYPDPVDPSKAGLVDEIRAAFADTPYPGDDNLCGSEQGDEPAECALEFRGLDWRKIHPHLLANNYTSLSFLTAEGFRYFLPAYLIAELTGVAGDTNANPDFYLTHGFATPEPRPALEKFDFSRMRKLLGDKFSEEEFRAVIERHEAQKDSTDWFAYGIGRMSFFNRWEREAVIRYLEHVAENDEFSKADINEALDRYWRPSLETKMN